MHLMYFTEQPMSAYSEQAGRDFGATALMFPNSNFDPVEGSRLVRKPFRIDELIAEMASLLEAREGA